MPLLIFLNIILPVRTIFVYMQVTDDLIKNIAHLSRLHFSDEELADLKNDMQRMISFVEKLSELDTSGTEPMLYMTNESNVLRNDEIRGSIYREEALVNAPVKNHEFFIVPKVIKT
ncbi:MAG TPA: Asp-tRNA(Asn)/Glu-tRNA(Gln) amidotransferase subunit GatC [Chitinophagaceae bacterium]|nr:Asp-tRNA(Asn)/Glu-tRNA(Gln) amidotransferase subunit GatC [Chitinophagaceae bacterium]